ncbi:hypothetical protein JCM5353_006890 [Sporobolomyces roseus]
MVTVTSLDKAYWKTYSTLLLQLKGLIEAGNAGLLAPQPFVDLLNKHIRKSQDLADLNHWWKTERPDKIYLESQHPTVALRDMVKLCETMRKSTKGGPVVELENLVRESLLTCTSIFEAAEEARQAATNATKVLFSTLVPTF